MQYEHIFFDLDHTLWDFETNSKEALYELADKHKLFERGVVSMDRFLEEYFIINEKLWDDYRKGIIDKEQLRYDRFHLALQKFGIDDINLTTAFSDDYVSSAPYKTNLFPHAIETLEYLHGKYILHIVTNGFEETQHLKMRNCNIEKYFSEIITSERSGFKKPDKRMFEFSLNEAKANSSTSIMIGDSLEADIIGAREAGLAQIYFNPSRKTHYEKITHEIISLRELVEIL
ncbi:MAG: YjjG family noncanonical pyrimidine nucleotidase [Bacteroidia bacterium]